MNISSSTSSLSLLSSLNSTSATSSVSAANLNLDDSSTDATDSVSSSGSDQTKLSKAGQLFSKLQDLESSDPAKAKQVLTSIADSLSSKASDSGDSRLQALADKFKDAASTGDLSGLKPPSGGHHGGPHGAGGPPPGPPPDDSSSDSSSSSSSSNSVSSRYRQHTGTSFQDIDSIISSALSSATAA